MWRINDVRKANDEREGLPKQPARVGLVRNEGKKVDVIRNK